MVSVLIELRQTVLLEESSLGVIENKSTHHIELPGMELSMVVTMDRSNEDPARLKQAAHFFQPLVLATLIEMGENRN